MDWDAIIKAYPDNIDEIKRAREVRDRVISEIKGLEIPLLEKGDQNILENLDIETISALCSSVWKKTLTTMPPSEMNKTIKDFLEAEYTEGGDEDTDLVVGTVLREYLRTLREANPHLTGPEGAENKACPFCGSNPKIAFDSETERRMFCPVCGNSWTFPRVKCPFCKNSDHNTLGYFEAEDIKGKRVYFCKECTHYFKVIDTRIRVALDAETENILSLELDHLAREEGFREA